MTIVHIDIKMWVLCIYFFQIEKFEYEKNAIDDHWSKIFDCVRWFSNEQKFQRPFKLKRFLCACELCDSFCFWFMFQVLEHATKIMFCWYLLRCNICSWVYRVKCSAYSKCFSISFAIADMSRFEKRKPVLYASTWIFRGTVLHFSHEIFPMRYPIWMGSFSFSRLSSFCGFVQKCRGFWAMLISANVRGEKKMHVSKALRANIKWQPIEVKLQTSFATIGC